MAIKLSDQQMNDYERGFGVPDRPLVRDRIMKLINELAPVSRRDEWWSTDGPYEIIAKHLGEKLK